ncbi:MAG: hypothetical protein ACP5QN_00110 [Minisyncoccia bacterium]
MNILELLKQLKKDIKPDKNFALSLRAKLLTELNQPVFVWQPKKIKILQTIYSFGLTFAVLVIILFAFSLFHFLTPKLGALNPEAIKAEADAIDFQIQLSNLIYKAPDQSNIILNPSLNKDIKKELSTSKTQSSSSLSNENTSSSSSSTSLSVDEALDYLSK